MPMFDIPQVMEQGGQSQRQIHIGGAPVRLSYGTSNLKLTATCTYTPMISPILRGLHTGSDEGRLKLHELMTMCTKLSKQVLDLEKEKDAQALEAEEARRSVHWDFTSGIRAAQRAAEIRSRPPTKTQLRNLMMTYLKNMGGYKHNQLKGKTYEEIQGLYKREQTFIHDFVPMDSEKEEKKLMKPESEGKK
ncbi:hypothetical protein Tco_0716938, partial [Tanacetum coccineum]